MRADAVVCGAGIAGIAAAWNLVQREGYENVLLLERDSPLSLTSDKSTECYRNWWQGPGDAMVRLSSRSIELMEELAATTSNAIGLDRRGYLYLSADPGSAARFEAVARECESLGAGKLRIHGRSAAGYSSRPDRMGEKAPGGADLLLDTGSILRHFPFVTPEARAALHVRNAGVLSAQQLGMTMLEQARTRGTRLLRGELDAVALAGGQVSAVEVATADGPLRVDTPVLVNAAGPYFRHVGEMVGLELPVFCERHAKLTFADREAVMARNAPLSIWCDPTVLPWSEEERDALNEHRETRFLTEPFPPGVHGRPVGAGDSVMLYWTYDCPVEEPRFPVTADPHYPEILMRAMSVMVPGLGAYRAHIPQPHVDGGYYTKTAENRPLVGATPVGGFHLMGAFSGFGIMIAMAAGELLADHVAGAPLPAHAAALSLSRYDDPSYAELLGRWPESGQI